jgi:small-conductance mechanosensitive channel
MPENGADQWLWAVVTVAVALVLAFVVDRWFARRARRLAETVVRGGLSQGVDTRLRFLQRLITTAIVLIGIAIALSEFTDLGNLAASLLASGAIVAAIVGFAARQTLANFVAGIMLAITQPLRVGDWVTFEEHYGVVEDVRLSYTILRTLSETRILIPNERLAAGILRNDTLATEAVGLEVAIWLPPESDAERALAALADETGHDAAIAEITPEGVRVAVSGDRVPPQDRARRESELRAACLRRLRAEGLLAEGGAAASPN